jgi:DNA polymerase III delta subunit
MDNKNKALYIKGDDEIAIQKRLDQIIQDCRKKNLNLIVITNEDTKRIQEIAKSSSLFGGESFFVIKDPINIKLIQKYFGEIKEEKYEVPKNMYKFLDSFYPGNEKVIKIKYLTIRNIESSEKTFAFMVKLIQDLIWIKTDLKSLNYPEWRLIKLNNQAENYSLTQLKSILKKLIDIDLKVKTGEQTTETLLDLFILGRLE